MTWCTRLISVHLQLSMRPHFRTNRSAGALMWVFITFVYLLPAVVITMQILSPSGRRDPEHASTFGESPGMSLQ